MMAPHKHCQPTQYDVTQAVQKIDPENGLAAGDRVLLTQAADAVVAELGAVSLQTVQTAASRMDEAICAALLDFGSGTVAGEELAPLKTQLQYVQDVLQLYAHATLSFCSLPIEGEAAVLSALTKLLVNPVLKHVTKVTKSMCDRIEEDVPLFQHRVSGKGVEDKGIYENLFKKYTGESASQSQRAAYRSVLVRIDEMQRALERTGRTETTQDVSDLLSLALRCRTCSEQFGELVDMFAGGTTTTTTTSTETSASTTTTTTYIETSNLFPEVTIKQRKGLKALFRMIEKGILKGPMIDVWEERGRKRRDWEDALAAETVDCSKILDGVGCIFLCGSFVSMDALVKRIIETVAQMDGVHICRIKNRWEKPTVGGWRDLMLNLIVGGLIVEVQVAHKELYFARKQWGHSTYGDVRCFQELLAFTGNAAAPTAPKDDGSTYDIIFSHKTDQLPFVQELIARMPGIRCFCQNDLDQTQNSWKLEWYKAYKTATACVCVLTKEYLLSGPCCLEWNTALDDIGKRVVLAVDSPDDIVGHVDQGGALCDDNIDVYLHLKNNNPVLLKSGKTVPELCAAIVKKVPQPEASGAPVNRMSLTNHTLDSANTLGESSVDILVIVDYPTHGGGDGAIEPAKYIAPLQALETALNAKFVGTQARIRFHTPQSIVQDDLTLLKERIPCLCWMAMGEEAPAVDASLFTSSLWAAHGGGCDFAITLMKHGAEFLAGKLMGSGCAERVLWIAADYTAQSTNGFLANGKSKSAAIPDVFYAALTSAAFNDRRSGGLCCAPVLALALKRSTPAGIKMSEGCSSMSQIAKDDERPQDDAGITLSQTPSEPAHLTNTMVGVPHHSSVDLNQWSSTCTMLQQLKESRDGVHVVVVAEGTELERKVVAWTVMQSYIAVAGRFDLVVYRDADVPASAREDPSTFDLPFDTYGDQDVLVWMDSRSEFPLAALREAINAYVDGGGVPLPWTFVLTATDGLPDVTDEFEGASTVALPQAIGTTVNESSEDLIRLFPSNPTLDVLNILDVITASQLLDLLAVALPQTDADGRGVRDYFDQILISENNGIVVRGMAPNTKFLFELRNDLIDGSLERRINELLLGYVDTSVLGGQKWTLDKAAFTSIYPQILSQMDQLSPHQREKLHECEAAERVHVTGPAGCGKTFIALHMVVDLIEAAEMSSGVLSKDSPILFVGKNQALCMFFVNWITQRLRKSKKTKEAKRLVSTYLRVLHTSPFEDRVFALKFGTGSGNNIEQVSEVRSSEYSFLIVDEAHHIFAAGSNSDDAATIVAVCTSATRSLLLSDISQGETAVNVVFPRDHKDVVLQEVVRNSSRIVTASLPFCRSSNLADVTCNHGVRGPPLEPFVFDNCGSDVAARYMKYVEGIMHGIRHMNKNFPGAAIHDNLVILVPNVQFKEEVLPLLTRAMNEQIPAPGISIVNSVDGAFAEPKKSAQQPNRIVLDSLESFDGMERLFVFVVGLDSVKTTEGCCGVYRAITRAHMFVCVVQEHLPGGWLEFTATVQRDEKIDFDEAKERERVARENLAVIASLDAAAAVKMRAATGVRTAIQPKAKPEPGIHSLSDDDDSDHADGDHDDGDHVDSLEPKTASLVRIQNVWNSNLNSTQFAASISALSFDPLPNSVRKFTIEELKHHFMPLVTALFQQPESAAFQDPVDPAMLQIPDYFEIIKKPMDLSTIRRRLDDGYYTDPWDVCDDIRLMWRNAWLYNPKDSRIYMYTTKLSGIFDERVDLVMTKLGFPLSDPRRAPSSTIHRVRLDDPVLERVPPPPTPTSIIRLLRKYAQPEELTGTAVTTSYLNLNPVASRVTKVILKVIKELTAGDQIEVRGALFI